MKADFTKYELQLLAWASRIAIEWEENSIDCQTDPYSSLDLKWFKKHNDQSRKKTESLGRLIEKIKLIIASNR